MDLINIIGEWRRVILDEISDEMKLWLSINYKEKYLIEPHMVRYRYAGPSIRLEDCVRQEGYEIWFDNSEGAVAFKLRWS